MASMPHQQLDVGTILSRTAEIIRANLNASALFVVAFTFASTLGDSFTESEDPGLVALGGAWQLLVGIASIAAFYVLMEIMLKSVGLFEATGPRRFLPYLGQSILMGLGVAFGMLLLIVPGVLLAIRWSIAQPLLVGRHVPAIDAMRESWEKTRGHGLPIFLAGLVIVVPMLILIFGIAFAGTDQESMGTGLFALFGINLVSNAASVVMTAMVAALLGLIDPPGHGVGDVFS